MSKNKVDFIYKIVGTCVGVCAILGIIWANLAEPRVCKIIEVKIDKEQSRVERRLNRIDEKIDILLERTSKLEGRTERR